MNKDFIFVGSERYTLTERINFYPLKHTKEIIGHSWYGLTYQQAKNRIQKIVHEAVVNDHYDVAPSSVGDMAVRSMMEMKRNCKNCGSLPIHSFSLIPSAHDVMGVSLDRGVTLECREVYFIEVESTVCYACQASEWLNKKKKKFVRKYEEAAKSSLDKIGLAYQREFTVSKDDTCYRVDFYIHDLDIFLEIDEKHHASQVEADRVRQDYIEAKTGKKVYRIKAKTIEQVKRDVSNLVSSFSKLV